MMDNTISQYWHQANKVEVSLKISFAKPLLPPDWKRLQEAMAALVAFQDALGYEKFEDPFLDD